MALEYILLSTFVWKIMFLAIFKSISAENCPFLAPFLCIPAGMGAYFPALQCNSLHHRPLPGPSPANSRRNKQFLSRPHGL